MAFVGEAPTGANGPDPGGIKPVRRREPGRPRGSLPPRADRAVSPKAAYAASTRTVSVPEATARSIASSARRSTQRLERSSR